MVEENKQMATLADVGIDCKATLATDQKKAFVKIVEDEFSRRNHINDAIIKEKKEQLLSEYRKQVDFDSLLKNIQAAESAVARAKENLQRVGLDENGEINNYRDRAKLNFQARKGLERVENLVEAIEREYDVHTLKNKLVARLWLARTYAEAAILLKEVMGNEIIPSIRKTELQQ